MGDAFSFDIKRFSAKSIRYYTSRVLLSVSTETWVILSIYIAYYIFRSGDFMKVWKDITQEIRLILPLPPRWIGWIFYNFTCHSDTFPSMTNMSLLKYLRLGNLLSLVQLRLILLWSFSLLKCIIAYCPSSRILYLSGIILDNFHSNRICNTILRTKF